MKGEKIPCKILKEIRKRIVEESNIERFALLGLLLFFITLIVEPIYIKTDDILINFKRKTLPLQLEKSCETCLWLFCKDVKNR